MVKIPVLHHVYDIHVKYFTVVLDNVRMMVSAGKKSKYVVT
jgi:hypothetical protein